LPAAFEEIAEAEGENRSCDVGHDATAVENPVPAEHPDARACDAHGDRDADDCPAGLVLYSCDPAALRLKLGLQLRRGYTQTGIILGNRQVLSRLPPRLDESLLGVQLR